MQIPIFRGSKMFEQIKTTVNITLVFITLMPPGTQGWPRYWRNQISRLAWERLGVPPEELVEVAEERNIWYDRRVFFSRKGFYRHPLWFSSVIFQVFLYYCARQCILSFYKKEIRRNWWFGLSQNFCYITDIWLFRFFRLMLVSVTSIDIYFDLIFDSSCQKAAKCQFSTWNQP